MDTRTIQARLLALGSSPGAIDGAPGPNTTAALKRFQAARGLAPDGIAGPRTLAALFPQAAGVTPVPAAPSAVPSLSSGLITAARVRAFAPNALSALVVVLDGAVADFAAIGITTPRRARHFMSEIAVESQGLTRLEENLNYSAARLVEVWPKRFPSIAAATPYAHNPEALANKTYGGRLGNTQIGDGWRYRGSGLLQTTGRANFRAAGHEADPDTLRQPVGALASALKFWSDNHLNAAADTDNVSHVRQIVNGGQNGLDLATQWLAKARRIFV